MAARKIILWGMGKGYDFILNQVNYEVLKGNIQCDYVVCREKDKYVSSKDGFAVISKKDISDISFDYVIVTASGFFEEIKREAVEIGIDESRILEGNLLHLPQFDFALYASLIENPVTILSDDCWAGYVYNRLKLPFTTPLINTYWDRKEYSKFIAKPLFYLDTELKMVREGNLKKEIHPIGSIGTDDDYVKIDFVHCYDFDNAFQQWNRRIKRINRENIFVKMGFPKGISEEEKKECITAFNSINCNKVLFYNGDESIESAFKDADSRFIWQETIAGDRVDHFNYNDYCRLSYFWDLDILKMLNGIKPYSRYF